MSSKRDKVRQSQASQDEGFCSAGPSHQDDTMVQSQLSQGRRRQSQKSQSSKRTTPDTCAGTILKLSLTNFMCHGNLQFELNPRANLIIGKNGSGKSAIQTAICIALGARAAATNRAVSLKKLIKTKCHTAAIEIVLDNRGDRAYRPEMYGSKIIISRTFSESSSSLKLKSERGHLISAKKDELDRMLAYLQIQVFNPVAILNQDTARTFFASTNAAKKYEFFLRGTQIDEMESLLREIINHKIAINEGINVRTSEKEHLENELSKLEVKEKLLRRVEEYRNKEETLKTEYFWAKVHKRQNEIREQEANLENQTAQHQDFQKSLDVKIEGEDELKKNIADLEQIVDENRSKIKEYIDAHKQKREEYQRIRREYATKADELKSSTKEMDRKKNDMTTLETEITRLESSSSENSEKLLQIKKKREGLEEQLREIASIVQEADREISVLRSTAANTSKNMSEIRETIKRFEREKTSLSHQLSQLQDAGNTLNIYGPFMQQLNERINQACARGAFKHRPKGPLGQYVKVQDAEWGPAIERFLGPDLLKSFIVDNSKDNDTLMRIMREVCRNQRRPDIHCGTFNNTLYPVHNKEVKYKQYQSLFGALEISDPDVANTLIDFRVIETVLLIDNNDIICNLMENVQRVPRNCTRCINKFADTYFPAPSYRQYDGLDPRKNHRSQWLQVSIDEARNSLTEKIEEINQQIALESDKLPPLQQELEANQAQIRKWQRIAGDKRKEMADIRRELNNEEETDTEEYRLPLLKGELQDLKNDITRTETKISNLENETKVLKQQMASSREACEKTQKFVSTGEDSEISKELDAKKDQLKELVAEKKRLNNRVVEALKKITIIEKKIQDLKKQEETERQEAAKLGPEMETRDMATIDRDHREVEAHIREAGRESHISYEELKIEILQKRNSLKKITKAQEKLAALFERYDRLALTRSKMCTKNIQFVTADVKIHFQMALKMRKYQGALDIDHKKKEIAIMVSPTDGGSKSVDTTSLSGGERSYSSVAFIMSLWSVTNIPFYSMDEFDVFMDNVNREHIVQMLLGFAEKSRSQFIFLTPQDCSTVDPSDDLSIFRMADPERTANCSMME
nr:PREDICTED: structural maintenance of chromosomes protein 6 [Bemisia tabaci]